MSPGCPDHSLTPGLSLPPRVFVKCTEAGCGTARGQGVLSSNVHGRLARWGVLPPGKSGSHKAHHRTISQSKNTNTSRKDFFFFLKRLLYRPLYRLNSGRLGSFLKALRGSSVHFQRGKCVSQTMPKVFKTNDPSPGGSSSGTQRWVASHRLVPWNCSSVTEIHTLSPEGHHPPPFCSDEHQRLQMCRVRELWNDV